ncbi:MAG: hypothetical protein CMM07_24615 [Rhodopirellula sp.]|nr:hypothetical protein [Rhodopirellula sp.]
MILVPCLVALLTWFALRCLQGWWVFAGINDKRAGIVFVAAMIGLAAVVISEFLAYQRQIAVRTLAKRMSLCFSSEPEPSLKMQIKHLVIGKGSQLSVIVENVVHGEYQGMPLVMADSLFMVDRGEDTTRKEKTIWFFTDMVALYPKFRILPRTGSNAGKNKSGGDLSHFPEFSKLYVIQSDEQDAAEQILSSDICGYFRSRHNWQVYANGPCIAFVRDGKIGVDEWEMYLSEAIGAVKLLNRALEELLERQMPMENLAGCDPKVLPSDGDRVRVWGTPTETTGDVNRENKSTALRRTSLIDQATRSENVRPRAVNALQFEKKEAVGAFAAMESLVNSANQQAIRYHEVSDFMQHLPPRTIPRHLRNENVPRLPFVFWFMSFPMIGLSLVTILLGMPNAGGVIKAGHQAFLVFGVANLLAVCAAWAFFYRRRRVYIAILRDGVSVPAIVENCHSTDDYDMEDWLMCRLKVQVQFCAGAEFVQSEVKLKGMQMKTLQQCLDEDRDLFVLYLKNRPNSFLLSAQLASRRFAE